MPHLAPRLCRVSSQRALDHGYFVTEVEYPALASAVTPGQFVMVRPCEGFDPLLGRPFSVFETSSDGERFSLLYNIVGRGTAHMAARKPGDLLSILGPLGRGFDLEPSPARAVLVSGGIGVAGLYLLAIELKRHAVPTTVLFGARSARDLVAIDRLESICDRVEAATDDGSRGHHGLVTALLERELDAGTDGVTAYACGPSPMLAAVRKMTVDRGVACVLALEARMACGFGVCLGCVVPSATHPGTYRLVCTDGPCIDAKEVLP